MMNQVLKAIEDRRSIRGYESKQITQQELDALLKAAVEAPSARNSQPWHFAVVQDRALLDRINAKVSPMPPERGRDVFYGAQTVIFISADPRGAYSALDSGIAVQNIALAAHALGLGSVILGMPREAFQSDEAAAFKSALKFPEGHELMIAIAVGYGTVTKPAHEVLPGKIDIIK